MESASRLSSLPTRSTPHSSRRLSSNSSLSSLSELGMLEPRRPLSSGSGSGSSKTISSSPNSSVQSNSSSSNMMKELGSRFTLKRKDGCPSSSTTSEDAIEELADENEAVSATAKPRGGRILTSSNASTARPSSIYGSLSQSGDRNRLRHRSSVSNLNASNSSIASTSSNGGNTSVQRQPGTLRHRASMSSLSGSDNSATSPPATALRQPGTLRHRSSISSLSGSVPRDNKLTSPPNTAVRQPGALRHRSSITSLSSVAMVNPAASRTASSSQALPSRIRTMSTTGAPLRPSNFPSSANESITSNNTSAMSSISNSRRLSATHTGLASLRARTTSLISPPKAIGSSSGLNRPNTGTVMGDTSIARRGIPKSSTTSIARIASSSSSTSSISMSHKRIGSLANRSQLDSTPKSSTITGGGGLRRLQDKSIVENSPGLEDLVNNTTLQMADLKDMLSPIAISRVSSNFKNVNHHIVGSFSSPSSSTGTKSQGLKRMNMRTPVDIPNEKEEIENTFNSPSKSALPILHRTDPSTKTTKNGSSSPSPSKNRTRNSACPKKGGKIDVPRSDGSSGMKKHASPVLTQDGLPALPGSRSLAPPLNTLPFPTSSSSNIKRKPSHSPALSEPSHHKEQATTTPRIRMMKESSEMTDDDEMEKLLSQEGFLSPGRFLAGDDSTLLMQNEMSHIIVTPLKMTVSQSSSSHLGREKEDDAIKEEEERKALIGKLISEEREKVQKQMKLEMERERILLEARMKEQDNTTQRKLEEREMELRKQSKEMTTLQKMLANEAKNAVKLVELESKLSKQESYDSNIRIMKRDVEDLKHALKKEKMDRIVEKSRDIWKYFSKELEIEKDIVSGQLESLDHLRGLIGHVALCVERKLFVSREGPSIS